jgi:ribosome biogenesis GTPase
VKKGLVFKTTGKSYDVLIDGKIVVCSLRGKIRLQGLRTTNPIAAGDYVDVELDSDGNGSINRIHDRTNYIIRKSINLSKQTHILAANIDCAWIVVTPVFPNVPVGPVRPVNP